MVLNGRIHKDLGEFLESLKKLGKLETGYVSHLKSLYPKRSHLQIQNLDIKDIRSRVTADDINLYKGAIKDLCRCWRPVSRPWPAL